MKTETRIAQGSFASRPLSDADSANSRAALPAAMNRPVEARALVAVTVADSDGRRRQAQQMLDFFLKNPTAPR